MRKILYTTLSLLLVSAVFTNCKKEGVFNPKNKISKVYVSFNGEKRLDQEWTWDENLLTKMWCHPDAITVYSYTKKQLSKMEMSTIYGATYAEVTYNGKFYDKIDIYDSASKEKKKTVAFTYDKKKVSKIVETIYANANAQSMGSVGNEFVAAFIPSMILEETQKMLNTVTMQKANEDKVITHEMTYEKDNLKEWKISYTQGKNNIERVYVYNSYDENKSPFYASNPLLIDNGTNGDAETPFYKNNPTQITATYAVNGNKDNPVTYDYKYQYNDKKFPIEVIKKISPLNIMDTTYYEYK